MGGAPVAPPFFMKPTNSRSLPLVGGGGTVLPYTQTSVGGWFQRRLNTKIGPKCAHLVPLSRPVRGKFVPN